MEAPLDRKKARELLIKSKFYQHVAVFFAIVGLLVFVVLYNKSYDGNIFLAISHPEFIAIVLIPFIPAAFVARMSARYRRQLNDLIESDAGDAKSPDMQQPGKGQH